jgi:hypothetical protein
MLKIFGVASEGCYNVGRWRLEEEDNGGGSSSLHVEKTSFLAACFHVLKAELSKSACMGWAGLRPCPG